MVAVARFNNDTSDENVDEQSNKGPAGMEA